MLEALCDALEGTNVVALATNVPGPLAAARLSGLGARVIKIEPLHGDPLSSAAPAWYAQLHRDMEIVRVDLREERDREVVRRRVAEADLLLTAMRASALQRAGLAWTQLHARDPRLVHVAVVGEAAPHADRAGHDLTYQARAGLIAPPAMPRTLLADLAAAERTVSAALAALLARNSDGRGRYVEVGIVDAAAAMAAPLRYGLTSPEGVLGGALAAYALYPAGDGWVAVAALEAHFSERLRTLLEVDTLNAESIAAALARRSAQEWEALALASDVPLAAIRTQALGEDG